MLHTAVLVVAVFIAGLVVGVLMHAAIAEEAAASKSEVAGWAIRLRTGLVGDASEVKAKLMALAQDIEGKL